MRLKTVSIEQLALATGKVLEQARKAPVLIQAKGLPTLVMRPLADDDLADEMLPKSPAFRASIRRARQRRRAGKGVPLAEVRRRLKA